MSTRTNELWWIFHLRVFRKLQPEWVLSSNFSGGRDEDRKNKIALDTEVITTHSPCITRVICALTHWQAGLSATLSVER
jgi:hypothetical protein